MIVRVTLPGWVRRPEVAQQALREGIRQGLEAAAEGGRAEVVRRIMDANPRPPVDTGRLRQGISGVVRADGRTAVIAPSPATMAYAVAMEEGRRPGAAGPPLAPILRWVERKGIDPEDPEGAAAAIRRSIHRKGIKPRKFFERSRAGIRRMAGPLIAQGITLSLRRRGIV